MQGQPANIDHLKLKHSAEEQLKWELREAFLDNDYAQVKKTAQAVPDELKSVALGMAVESGSLMMLRIVFDNAKPALSSELATMMLLGAAKRQDAEMCAYLCERNAGIGVPRGESYAVVFGKFPDDKIMAGIDILLAAAPDKQAALDSMLKPAAAENKFAAMGTLIDRGAEMGGDAPAILAKLTIGSGNTDFFKDKAAYLALIDKCAAIAPPGDMADSFAGVAGMMAASGLQYTETATAFLRHGADPYYAYRHMGLEKLPAAQGNAALRDLYAGFEQPFTAAQRAIFNELFGGGYTLQDLKQEIDADGTTGLMLAARARVLPEVMQKTGSETLASEDLLRKNRRGQSLMSLAAQRDDAALLLDAGYWRRAEPGILATLNKELTEDVKRWVDLNGFAARLDHAALKEQAVRFKLRPKL